MRRVRILIAAAPLVLSGAGCVSLDPRPTVDALVVDLGRRSSLELRWPSEGAELALDDTSRALLADGLSPDDAAQLAWRHNPAVAAELAELGIAHADFAKAGRLHNPSLELSRLEVEDGAGAKREIGLAFGLLDGLLLPLRKKLGAMELEAARLRLGQRLLDVAADARSAWYAAAAADKAVARFTVLRDLAAAHADLAERRHRAGNLSTLELEEQRAGWHRSRLALAEARLEARSAREALQRLLGLWGADAAGWQLADVAAEPPAAEPTAGLDLEKLALEHRLDIRAARAGVDLVGKALALEKGARWVPIDLEVGVAREKEVDGVALIGPTLRLELPIFDTGAASVAKLEAELRRSRFQLDALAVEIRSRVREAADRLAAARDLYLFYRRTLLPQHELLFDQQLRHVNMMIHGIDQLVETRKEQLMTEHEAIERWRGYWQARVELERVLGLSLDRLPAPEATP